MNPANFNVGGSMPAAPNPQMPRLDNNQVMMNYVAQALHAQGTYTGWRAEVPMKERVVRVYQMFTSLRLIQPQADLQHLAQAALSFEQKAFKDAQQKVDYDKECNDKLVHIRDTRARQAAVMQNGMMPPGGPKAGGMRGVGQQPSFPQQMNRAMQSNPVAGQQAMAMGMTDPNQQAAMSQRPQQQQAMMQQPRVQQRPANALSLGDDLNNLSPQEYEHVCRLAHQIMSKTSQEDIEKIKMNLQNMSPEQRRYLSERNIDPLVYFFRSQALSQFRRHMKARADMSRAQNAGVDPNSVMMGADPTMNRQMFPNMMNLQRNSAFTMGNQPNLDPSSFIGNVENIQGQQADGLRSQEAGQLVVPASSSQMNQPPFNNPQNMFPMGQQLAQGGQANMSAAGLNPQLFAQQLQNNPNMPQDRPQPAAPFQPQAQAQNQAQAQARAHAAQKAQMAISQAGQANSHLQQPSAQQSPAMPMLNRPMPPGQMSPAQAAAQVRPPSRAPAMGQQPSMGGQQPMQGRPQIPPGLPPAIQEQLAQMSPEQLNRVLNQRRAMAMNPALARANAARQSVPMQQNMSQSAQGQPMANSQNMRSMSMQAQSAGMGGAQQMLPGQQMSLQQQQQQQQQQRQELYKMQMLQQSGGNLELSSEQSKEMDRLHFPPSLLGNNPNVVSLVPKNIKTWGQLKQWAATSPQLPGGLNLQKLMALQKFHFTQIVNQSKERNRNPDQAGQGPWMSVPGQAPQQGPIMNPQQQFAAGQQQPAINMAALRPVTAQDIQAARQRHPAMAQNFSDDQIRESLNKARQRQLMALAQQRAAQAQALAAQHGQPQTQAPQQTPVAAPAPGSQLRPEGLTTQPQQQTPATKTPATAAGKKAPPAKQQAAKRKLPTDETADAQNATNQLAQKTTAAGGPQGVAAPAPSKPTMPFTREQLAAMTPQQRAQIEAHMRRQQGQTRTRAAAEEAWNNLPEKIRQAYHDTLKQAPPVKPAAITPEQHAAMNQQLRDCTDMLGRMDTLVQWFAKIPGQEKNVRSLLAMRIQLMRQFKSSPDWVLNDSLTISPEYLTVTINYIKKLFHAMITRVSQHQNQAPGQRPGGPQPPMPQPNQNTMPALNATNLQQLQQQEEALQRARRASSQTAVSATSAVPPAPFGAPSPQGVPHAYGPGSMPPEQLKLPPPKKRKQSHAGATPTAGTPGSKPPTTRPADVKMPAAAAIGGAYMCSVAECPHHLQGFASQNALDKHVEESHKEEAIDDPLQFALDSARSVLVKDEDKTEMSSLKKDAQPTPAKAGVTASPMKPETGATPVTTGTTPMGRVPSQMGPKAASPASNQPHLTPRGPSTKGPTPAPTAKGKDGKKETPKASEPGPSVDVPAKDPWTDSAVSLEAINDAFMDLGDGGLGFGAMDEFLNADMFTNTQDTPDSVESAPVTQTPKDGELPRPDDTTGKAADVLPDENWIPADWINLPGGFEDGFLMSQPMIDIDWDAVERGELEDPSTALVV